MRDHTKYSVFQDARTLALEVYRITETFPSSEQFGLTSQLRRGAVSIASNIVEGCARRTDADFAHFVDIAFASAREMEFQLSLAHDLGFLKSRETEERTNKVTRALAALILALRPPKASGLQPPASGVS